jgi:hypothetical protein
MGRRKLDAKIDSLLPFELASAEIIARPTKFVCVEGQLQRADAFRSARQACSLFVAT